MTRNGLTMDFMEDDPNQNLNIGGETERRNGETPTNEERNPDFEPSGDRAQEEESNDISGGQPSRSSKVTEGFGDHKTDAVSSMLQAHNSAIMPSHDQSLFMLGTPSYQHEQISNSALANGSIMSDDMKRRLLERQQRFYNVQYQALSAPHNTYESHNDGVQQDPNSGAGNDFSAAEDIFDVEELNKLVGCDVDNHTNESNFGDLSSFLNCMDFSKWGKCQNPTPINDEGAGEISASMDTGNSAQDSTSKKRNSKGKAKKGSDSLPSANSKVTKPKRPKGPTLRELKKARNERNLYNPDALRGTDVFRDAAENFSRAEQPTFQATKRGDALKQMIESVPEEHRDHAKIDIAQVAQALKHFTPPGSCRSDGQGGWKVKGMKTSLTHYQMLGVSFMRQCETRPQYPKGGIQGDHMGLGKTIMALANNVNGIKEKSRQTTLIVVPPALLNQWINEISQHTDPNYLPHVFRFHCSSRMAARNPAESLLMFDIVITTYSEVQRSYPKVTPPDECRTDEEKATWLAQYYEENKGILHQVTFHRIVLDEAHAIKNPNSATALSCFALDGKFRWAITGTPCLNSIQEFYSYFRFLRVPEIHSLRQFKKEYCAKGATKNGLTGMLRRIMVRRTHQDELFGAKLLDLPQPIRLDLKCNFFPIEHDIYDIVRTRIIIRINSFLKNEDVKAKFSHIFTLFLVLRQLTSHVLLIQNALETVLQPRDFDKLDQVLEKYAKLDETVSGAPGRTLLHLRAMIDSTRRQRFATLHDTTQNVKPFNPDDDTSNASTGGTYGLHSNYAEYFKDLRHIAKPADVVESPICRQCNEVPTDPYATCRQHTYCFECLMLLWWALREDLSINIPCNLCKRVFFGPDPGPTFWKTKLAGSQGSQAFVDTDRKSSLRRRVLDGNINIERWINDNGDMLPSAKTLAIKAQVLNWLREIPNVKIIIYTQFLVMIDILAKICDIEDWPQLRYTGVMNIEQRAKAINQFQEHEGPCILLCSLKAGGLGLNLTMATRVINTDLWWNSAVEQQAFCRTYRKGQDQETAFARFIMRDTIDEAIIQMQDRKDQEIHRVVDNVEKAHKTFSTNELLSLFGEVCYDDEGNTYISNGTEE